MNAIASITICQDTLRINVTENKPTLNQVCLLHLFIQRAHTRSHARRVHAQVWRSEPFRLARPEEEPLGAGEGKGDKENFKRAVFLHNLCNGTFFCAGLTCFKWKQQKRNGRLPRQARDEQMSIWKENRLFFLSGWAVGRLYDPWWADDRCVQVRNCCACVICI